jgi:hypothetical protein
MYSMIPATVDYSLTNSAVAFGGGYVGIVIYSF